MLRPKQCLLFLSLAGFVLAGCNQPPASSLQPRQAVIAAGEIGSHLPEFSAKDLQGREISSADLRGKVVLVDFWATWCQPCKKEMPGYQKLLNLYGSRGFAVIGFSFDTMMELKAPPHFQKKSGVHSRLPPPPTTCHQRFATTQYFPNPYF